MCTIFIQKMWKHSSPIQIGTIQVFFLSNENFADCLARSRCQEAYVASRFQLLRSWHLGYFFHPEEKGNKTKRNEIIFFCFRNAKKMC
jgi:hypothetical protein